MPCRNPPSPALLLSTWVRTRGQRALRDQVSPLELRVSQVGQRIKAGPGANTAVVTSVTRLIFPHYWTVNSQRIF